MHGERAAGGGAGWGGKERMPLGIVGTGAAAGWGWRADLLGWVLGFAGCRVGRIILMRTV